MLIYEDLVELARMCARNARITTSRDVADELWHGWRRNIRPRLLRWVTSLKSATNPDLSPKNGRRQARQTQITYTRAPIRTTLAVSIRISSSSKPATKRTLRTGTLHKVPDPDGSCAVGTEAKMRTWNPDASLPSTKRTGALVCDWLQGVGILTLPSSWSVWKYRVFQYPIFRSNRTPHSMAREA